MDISAQQKEIVMNDEEFKMIMSDDEFDKLLIETAHIALKNAREKALKDHGYVVEAKDGWIIRKNIDGSEERLNPIDSVNKVWKHLCDTYELKQKAISSEKIALIKGIQLSTSLTVKQKAKLIIKLTKDDSTPVGVDTILEEGIDPFGWYSEYYDYEGGIAIEYHRLLDEVKTASNFDIECYVAQYNDDVIMSLEGHKRFKGSVKKFKKRMKHLIYEAVVKCGSNVIEIHG